MHLKKAEKYRICQDQLKSLINTDSGLIPDLANTTALLWETFGFFWTGFYLVQNGRLELGPFQGPVACTNIEKGRGVCGQSWLKNEILIVPDVHEFPGHIACNPNSRSEIVLPFLDKSDSVIGVLDIDSDQLGSFNDEDAEGLKTMLNLLTNKHG